MQKKLLTYAVIAAMVAVLVAPTLALAVVLPTVPGDPNDAVTANTLVKLIDAIVQFMITVSVVIAIGVIIWGGVQFLRNKPDEGKTILLNGVIGVAIILGVGLIMQTVARFVNTGGSIN